MNKIVGVGACVLDTIIEMPSYPTEDFKVKADNVFTSGGGPVGNALVAITRLGVPSSYLGVLSKDATGDTLIKEFNQYGVETKYVKQVENTKAFTSYIVLNKANGSRTCVYDRGNVPQDPSLLDFSVLDDASILHLDGNSLPIAIEAAKIAKKNGILVSLDAGGLYSGIEELLSYVDILIPSEEFATKITKKDTVEEAIQTLNEMYHPKVLVVTMGSKGGVYMDGNALKYYPCFKVECIDSNGAGDTFHGAFLVAYLDGKSILDCCKFASATSAIKCQKAGVRVALPYKEEVNKFLLDRD
jgi:sugar/nucleoside kinase (ribokinase family)